MNEKIMVAVGSLIIIVVIVATVFSAVYSANTVDGNKEVSTSETSAIPTLTPTTTPTESSKKIVIVFDDGWLSQFTNAYPILKLYGFKASFGVVTSYVEGEYPAYLSWANIKDLQDGGQDIQSHSYSHKYLNNVTSHDELIQEIQYSKTMLKEHGFTSNVFIYPYGEGTENQTVRTILQQNYLAARGTNDEAPLNLNDFDVYDLNAYDIHAEITLNQFANYCNTSSTSSVAIVFYHQIDTEDDHVTPEQFTEQMQYLKTNGYAVITLNELLTSMLS
ncbi:MAG: polysaccharide deacetylase family protein [Candidatus Bathyarchaeia archaeon]|jgi:peptidoglycan/xylan/chitin deacetylase (PgdA/CDA1 family)